MKTTEQLQEAYENHKEALAVPVVESTGLKKLKIAICVSGQTRSLNDNPKYTEDLNKIIKLFDEYDYDLFGHTWSDQDDPHPGILENFTEYKTTDQSTIWDEINVRKSEVNWTQYFQTRWEWMDYPEYRDILAGKSDISFIDFAKERIYGSVGQIWSAHESFLLTKNHAYNNYKFVVKIRWDSEIRLFHGHEHTAKLIDRFKENVRNWSHRLYEFRHDTVDRYPNCLCADNFISEHECGPYANDHLYIFDSEALTQMILPYSPVELFTKLITSHSKGRFASFHMPSAHTLWMMWIQKAGFLVQPLLPNFLQSNGNPDSPKMLKTNKDWNL